MVKVMVHTLIAVQNPTAYEKIGQRKIRTSLTFDISKVLNTPSAYKLHEESHIVFPRYVLSSFSNTYSFCSTVLHFSLQEQNKNISNLIMHIYSTVFV